MRRMITGKQGEFVENVSKLVEPIAVYPATIETSGNGGDIDEADCDFEEHFIGGGTPLGFNFPKVLEKYGLQDSDTRGVGYLEIEFSNDVPFPETINSFSELQAWMNTDAFIEALEDVGYNITYEGFQNDTVSYKVKELSFEIIENKLTAKVVLIPSDLKYIGQPIEEAIHPAYNQVEIQEVPSLVINGIGIFAGSLYNVPFKSDDLPMLITLPKVNYATINKDLKDTNFSADSYGLMFDGSGVISSIMSAQDITEFNSRQPGLLTLANITIGVNEDVYGITNTRIRIGKNVYTWDDGEEGYLLQGSFVSINSTQWIRFEMIGFGALVAYNS